MTESMKKKFEELNMTRDEIERFSEAMKKEEFRKLLVEYAEEISDPKNREIYEREISQLEAERGSDVTFIHPEPGFCLKTTQNGDKKCFINISKNEHLAKPTSSRQANGAQSGLMWQIPHTCSQPREDVDKSGKTPCVVYDVVFHPDAYRMGETNKRFQKLLIDSAIDTIQKNFCVKLDAVNATVLKHLNFKGHPTASVIRKPRNEGDKHVDVGLSKHGSTKEKENDGDDDPLTPLIDQIKKEYLDRQANEAAKKPAPAKVQRSTSSSASDSDAVQNEDAKYTIPKYRILHRGQVDFEDYATQMDNSNGVRHVNSTRPKELVVTIDLPLCKSAAGVNLDIFDTSLSLESSEPSYKLDLKFPFPVRSKEGKAKFDKSKRALSVTLPVVPFVENVEVMSSQIVSELPTVKELASEDANASIVSNDGQNQSSSILMSPTSLSSSSSSLSNDSMTTEDNLSTLDTEVDQTVPPAVQIAVQPATPVKYTLPKKILVKETKKHVNLKYFVPNYNRESLRISIDSESQLSLTFDSTSSGGYVQFYATHVHFYFIKSINDDYAKQEGNDTLPYPFIGAELVNKFQNANAPADQDLTVNFVNDELFEIKIRKRLSQDLKSSEDEIEAKKVRVSVNKPSANDDLFNENLNHAQSNGLMVLDIVQELNVDEDMKVESNGAADKSHIQKRASEQLNNMSKKDFILNFNKLVKENAEQDGDVDEDDVDDDEDEFADAIEEPSEKEKAGSSPSQEQSKQMSNAQFAKFKELKEARKAQQQERINGCELLSKTEKIDEVPENDESEESDEEKKYLASAEMNQNDADDSDQPKMSGRQHHSGSLSSSSNFSNENQGLSSSLNGSSSFNKLKVGNHHQLH